MNGSENTISSNHGRRESRGNVMCVREEMTRESSMTRNQDGACCLRWNHHTRGDNKRTRVNLPSSEAETVEIRLLR